MLWWDMGGKARLATNFAMYSNKERRAMMEALAYQADTSYECMLLCATLYLILYVCFCSICWYNNYNAHMYVFNLIYSNVLNPTSSRIYTITHGRYQ